MRKNKLRFPGLVVAVILGAANGLHAGEADLKVPGLEQVKFDGLGGMSGLTLMYLGIVMCAIGALFGLVQYRRTKNLPAHKSMTEVSHMIWETCKTYLFQQGKFLDIKFLLREVSCPVVFNTGCELADVNLQVIPATLNNGIANVGNPVINLQPHDTTIFTGHTAIFHVSSSNALQYYWKESRDNGSSWTTLQDIGNYTGTHTDQLEINQVPFSFNSYKYSCTLSSGNCSTISNPVLLHVDSLNGIFEPPKIQQIHVNTYPNPFTLQVNFEYTLPVAGYVTLALYDCQGKWLKNIVSANQMPGNHTVDTDLFSLTPGLYIYNLNVQNEIIHLKASGKINKQNP